MATPSKSFLGEHYPEYMNAEAIWAADRDFANWIEANIHNPYVLYVVTEFRKQKGISTATVEKPDISTPNAELLTRYGCFIYKAGKPDV